jgi:hypothetical protein
MPHLDTYRIKCPQKRKKATSSVLNRIYVKKSVMIMSALTVTTSVIRCDINSVDISTDFVMSITLISRCVIERVRWLYDSIICVINEIILSFIVGEMSCGRVGWVTKWWPDWWLIIWPVELIIWLIRRFFWISFEWPTEILIHLISSIFFDVQ